MRSWTKLWSKAGTGGKGDKQNLKRGHSSLQRYENLGARSQSPDQMAALFIWSHCFGALSRLSISFFSLAASPWDLKFDAGVGTGADGWNVSLTHLRGGKSLLWDKEKRCAFMANENAWEENMSWSPMTGVNNGGWGEEKNPNNSELRSVAFCSDPESVKQEARTQSNDLIICIVH